ncbi:hypothetical protein B8V81_0614 [Paenibacillus pasadenensis]|uniref:Uncharacterized protein n=1 Tax=Paenibacillus pasadenensis TaxID=217090 RepID=A0A2N5NDT4_9BACL|nr:hypothetical protein B8V81_0614 [Paenibacillus pasadenensis]
MKGRSASFSICCKRISSASVIPHRRRNAKNGFNRPELGNLRLN